MQMMEPPDAQKSTPFYVQASFILVLDILRYDIFVDPLNRLVNKLSEGTYSFLGDFLAILFAICALYLLLKYEGKSYFRLSFTRKAIGRFFLAFAALFVWSFLVANLFPISSNQEAINEAISSTNWWDSHALPIMMMLVGPICEELIYRGLATSLCQKWPVLGLDLLIPAALFGVLHLDLGQGFIWTDFLQYFGAGLILGLYLKKSQSIYSPIALHIAWNSFVYLL